MSHHTQYEHAICHDALVQIAPICGGVTALTNLLNEFAKLNGAKENVVSRAQLNNYVNRGDKLPYDLALMIAFLTKISLERLTPSNPINKIIRFLPIKLLPLQIPIKNIHLKNPDCLQAISEHRPMIVDTDGVLISGLIRFEHYKASGVKKVPVELFDLDALIFDKTIENINRFLISERFAIGCRLGQLAGNRQGQRNDLIKSENNSKKNVDYPLSLRSALNEVKGRKDEFIAQLIGFNSIGTQHNVKQVYFYGIPELREALDNNQLSIANAAEISKLPPEQQLYELQLKLKGVSK